MDTGPNLKEQNLKEYLGWLRSHFCPWRSQFGMMEPKSDIKVSTVSNPVTESIFMRDSCLYFIIIIIYFNFLVNFSLMWEKGSFQTIILFLRCCYLIGWLDPKLCFISSSFLDFLHIQSPLQWKHRNQQTETFSKHLSSVWIQWSEKVVALLPHSSFSFSRIVAMALTHSKIKWSRGPRVPSLCNNRASPRPRRATSSLNAAETRFPPESRSPRTCDLQISWSFLFHA